MTTFAGRPNTTLLVIDVQNGVVARDHERAAVVERIARLVDRARCAGVSIVWVQHADAQLVAGSSDWHLVPELVPASDEAIVAKKHGDAFEAIGLEVTLSELRVRRLIVVGAEIEPASWRRCTVLSCAATTQCWSATLIRRLTRPP